MILKILLKLWSQSKISGFALLVMLWFSTLPLLKAQNLVLIGTEWQDFILDATELEDELFILSYQADYATFPPQSLHRNLIYRLDKNLSVIDSLVLPNLPGRNGLRYIRKIGQDSLLIAGTTDANTDNSRLRLIVIDGKLNILKDVQFGTDRGAYGVRNVQVQGESIYVMGGSVGRTDTSVYWYHLDKKLQVIDSIDQVFGDYPNGQYVADFMRMDDSSLWYIMHDADPANPDQLPEWTTHIVHYSKNWELISSDPLSSHRKVRYYSPTGSYYMYSQLFDCRFISKDDIIVDIACYGANDTYKPDESGDDAIQLQYDLVNRKSLDDAFIGIQAIREQPGDYPGLVLQDGRRVWVTTAILSELYDSTFLSFTITDSNGVELSKQKILFPENAIVSSLKMLSGNRVAICGMSDFCYARGGLDPGMGYLIILDSTLKLPTLSFQTKVAGNTLLNVYPNPVKSGSEIKLSSDQHLQGNLVLVDMLGEIRGSWTLNSQEEICLPANLAPGTYILIHPESGISQKLIVQP